MALLRKLDQAFNYSIQQDLADQVILSRPFLAAMAGIDDIATKAGFKGMATRIQKGSDIGGRKAQWSMKVANPVARGVLARTGEINSLIGPYNDAFTTVTLECDSSYYEVAESVRVAEVEAFKNGGNEALADHIKNKTASMAEALADKLNEDFFPAYGFSEIYPTGLNGAGTASISTSSGAPREDKVMGVGWSCLTGQSHNATSSATAFTYCGLDIGATYVNSRSIAYGDANSTAVGITPRLINSEIILPGMRVGTQFDLCLVDSDVWSYLMYLVETGVVIGTADELNVGARAYTIAGIRYMYEPRLDLLPLNGAERHMLFLNTQHFTFKMKTLDNDPMNGTFKLKEVAETSSFWNATGLINVLFVNRNPRMHALVTKPSIP